MKTQNVTANDLASLADVTPRRIYQLAEEGIIPRGEGRKQYDLIACIKGLLKHYRDAGAAMSKEDKARKAKAEADIAEMECSRMEGILVLRSDYRANYADAIALGAAKISRLRSLTEKQKQEVFAALRSVKLRDLDSPDETE